MLLTMVSAPISSKPVSGQHPSSRPSLPFDSNITGRFIRAPNLKIRKDTTQSCVIPVYNGRHRRLKGPVFPMRGGVYVESGVVQ